MATKAPGHTWLTPCRKKGSMSPMRCHQFARRDGCDVGCKEAATPREVSILMSLRNDVMADIADEPVKIRLKPVATGEEQVSA